MPPEIALFDFPTGSITAPAGCGKTQLIADTLAAHTGPKPILVLTHTNAGVSALRARMARARVPPHSFRIATLDGFTMKLIGRFPARSGHNPVIMQLTNRAGDYPAIRAAALALLRARHVDQVLRSSYSHVLIDEYQDCNQVQHAIITCLAATLPTYVLGDPMQAIFNFAHNRLVDWHTDVVRDFPVIGALATPWRWRLAGAENLGIWLLQVRQLLEAGQPLDLHTVPPEVEYVQINAATADAQRRNAAMAPLRQGETALIIGDSANAAGRQRLTSQTPGATAVEAVDLPDLISFAQSFELTGPVALSQILNFAGSVMTGVGINPFLARVETIRNNRHRTPPTVAESVAVRFLSEPAYTAVINLLQQLSQQQDCRVYRPEILRCCIAALRIAASRTHTLPEAAIQIRERNRLQGRPLSRRSVGSTLLLKGLEADVAVILEPEVMNAKNLYVAMTRGAKRLIICSQNRFLGDRR
ncbi:hypothetical protein A244_25064 [Pseudomonas syringae pv. actinidiae ICMP 18807]|uniref:DNA 3'-5' helicase II n=1 Tax=Pseudomonas syringae pv. actinidiae ICMP 18807 TaxID=1194404 RepID=S6UVB2_PSESF|nr:UvrD-helicase domain-containing protein [Pseudomonas syringae]EPN45746.1 hypothetical protein A244_25064 [Pseudomonas syringae pv. actinidiae ICMP 18807]